MLHMRGLLSALLGVLLLALPMSDGLDQFAPGTESVTQTPSVEQTQTASPMPDQVGIDQSTSNPKAVPPSSTQTPDLEEDQTTSSIPDQVDLCQTHWFNWDDPSGVGDEELLSGLQQDHPQEICSAPTAIEARTVDGVPALQTGQNFSVNSTSAGFVCLNAEQEKGHRCHDYQVRFTCPPSFCSGGEETQGTEKVTSPAPVTAPKWKQTSPDQQAGTDQSSTPGPVTTGALRPAVEPAHTSSQIPGQGSCRTRWFNQDDPSGVGDEELLSDLQWENPHEICSAPIAIEAQTVEGVPAALTGQTFAVNDARTGFACLNAEQETGQRCYDYQVRFTCPPSFCSGNEESQRTEKGTTPAPVSELRKKQISPGQQVADNQPTWGPYPRTPSPQTPGLEQGQVTSSIPDQGLREARGTEKVTTAAPVTKPEQTSSDHQGVLEPQTENVTTAAPVTEPEQKLTSPDHQVGTDQSTPGPQPATPSTRSSVHEQAWTTPSPSAPGVKETQGTEMVTSGAPATEPEQKQTSADQQVGTDQPTPELHPGTSPAPTPVVGKVQTTLPIPDEGIKEPQGTETVTPPALVTEPEDKQTSLDQQGGIDRSTLGPQPVTPSSPTPGVEETWTTSSVSDQGVKEPQTEKGTPPAPVTEPDWTQTSPDQQAGVDQSTPETQPETSPAPTPDLGQVHSPSPVPREAGVGESTPETGAGTPPVQSPAEEHGQSTFPILNQAVCQTRWFNQDDPSGVGDEERLSDLRQKNPREICSAPTGIEVQTVGGIPAWLTGQEFAVKDASAGFVCSNADQGEGQRCHDYQVRFTCPPSFCCGVKEQPGTEKVTTPVQVMESQQQQVDHPVARPALVIPPAQTPPTEQVKTTPPIPDQGMYGAQACETEWFDRDNPFGTGDHELLSDLLDEHHSEICPDPTAMEVQTLNGTPASETGQTFAVNDVSRGFSCLNADQGEGVFCLDYRVRFTCPKSFCTGSNGFGSKLAPQSGSKLALTAPVQQVQTGLPLQVCKTRWFNRDQPTATGDYELLYYLRKDHPGAICSDPIALEVQTLQGIPASETGQKFACNDVIRGFACVNAHQAKGIFCHDYKVRFTCPETFCSGGDPKDGNGKERWRED
ncbi:uncharacterized protein LOC143824363 isoform X2 [Paroedura picta]|uniref:uncharacterized protein LOC143824363 isoform X2 n=1 Tax=Paroedura picta TaxID=143630 RepID=UPI0040571C69